NGLAYVFHAGSEANKFTVWSAEFSLSANYTIWTALLSTIGGLAAYGTDQLMAQRCFCCRNAGEAKKALIWSSVGQLLTFTCLMMGAALWAFYSGGQNQVDPNTGLGMITAHDATPGAEDKTILLGASAEDVVVLPASELRAEPMSSGTAYEVEQIAKKRDRMFPMFIKFEV